MHHHLTPASFHPRHRFLVNIGLQHHLNDNTIARQESPLEDLFFRRGFCQGDPGRPVVLIVFI